MAMYATDKDRREYQEGMRDALGHTQKVEANEGKGYLRFNSLNSKDLKEGRGACPKVPKPPRRAGLLKS